MNGCIAAPKQPTLHASSAIPAVASAITFGTRTTFEVEKSVRQQGAQDEKTRERETGARRKTFTGITEDNT